MIGKGPEKRGINSFQFRGKAYQKQNIKNCGITFYEFPTEIGKRSHSL